MPLPLDPDARMYYRVARQRLDEARLIADELQLWAAAQYLGGYAVECIVEAMLITMTPPGQRAPAGPPTIAWRRDTYGHDLGRLRMDVARRGASLSQALGKLRVCRDLESQ